MIEMDLYSDSLRMLLFGFIQGSMAVRQLTQEQAIREFFHGKNIKHTEADVQQFLNLWEGFTQTKVYKMLNS